MLQTLKNWSHLLSAFLATSWYGYPALKLTVIGITGTDGKTTTTELVYHILKNSGKKVSMISTIRAVIEGKEYDTGYHVTTPSPFSLQKYLKKAKIEGSQYVVLEVTSHALDQYRTFGTSIDIGAVLNVSHEHLDYHKTFDQYLKAKAKIFRGVKISILNRDDKSFDFLKAKVEGKMVTFGIHKDADYSKDKFTFKSPLLGEFNDYNILASVAITKTLGLDDQKIKDVITTFKGINGRMEEMATGKSFRVFIDFAHKPNALENALKTVRALTLGKVIVIFGCAGLRDKLKRPMMGEIAGRLADYVVLTAEDPRTEDVRDIINQIANGCQKAALKEADKLKSVKNYTLDNTKYFWGIPDRQEAINFAIRKLAGNKDLVLITGKGHEKSICYGKTEYPWSDFEAVKKALHD